MQINLDQNPLISEQIKTVFKLLCCGPNPVQVFTQMHMVCYFF